MRARGDNDRVGEGDWQHKGNAQGGHDGPHARLVRARARPVVRNVTYTSALEPGDHDLVVHVRIRVHVGPLHVHGVLHGVTPTESAAPGDA